MGMHAVQDINSCYLIDTKHNPGSTLGHDLNDQREVDRMLECKFDVLADKLLDAVAICHGTYCRNACCPSKRRWQCCSKIDTSIL